jgi:prepilin-type N-terminal cleavage/methylation domain-containing protein
MGMPIIKNIKTKTQQGFTLLEVLLVAAIIAILAGIVIIAINPSKNLADSRNAQRRSDVTTILNAIYQYSLDNNGTLPTTIPVSPSSAGEVCNTTGAGCTTPAAVDLGVLTASGTYLVDIPEDPQCPDQCLSNGAGYTVQILANGRVTVAAPDAENETIEVTR